MPQDSHGINALKGSGHREEAASNTSALPSEGRRSQVRLLSGAPAVPTTWASGYDAATMVPISGLFCTGIARCGSSLPNGQSREPGPRRYNRPVAETAWPATRRERHHNGSHRMLKTNIAAVALVAASVGAAQADVKVAVVGPITGQNAIFYEQMKHGAEGRGPR